MAAAGPVVAGLAVGLAGALPVGEVSVAARQAGTVDSEGSAAAAAVAVAPAGVGDKCT